MGSNEMLLNFSFSFSLSKGFFQWYFVTPNLMQMLMTMKISMVNCSLLDL